MNWVLIVVTSHSSKSEHIYTGSVEWSNGWEFEDRAIAFRNRNDGKIEYSDGLAGVAPDCDQDRIIWIKGKESFKPNEIDDLNRLIQELSEKCEVYFASHDEFVLRLLKPELRSRLKGQRIYGLTKNSDQFQKILKQQGDQRYLDHLADFDELFKAFFVNPVDVFPLLKHKLGGSFSAIDMNLQTLSETAFDQDLWKELVAEYRDGQGHDWLEQFKHLVYSSGGSGLKRLYEQEEKVQSGDSKLQIRKLWSKVRALIPEDPNPKVAGEFQSARCLYNQVLKVFDGLRSGDKRQVRECLQDGNPVRQWLDELNRTFDELEEIIIAQPCISTGAQQ